MKTKATKKSLPVRKPLKSGDKVGGAGASHEAVTPSTLESTTEKNSVLEKAHPPANPQPAKPELYRFSRVVFEANRRWVRKTENKTRPAPATWIPQFLQSTLSVEEVDSFGKSFFGTLRQLESTALYSEDLAAKNAAGRVIANFVAEILNGWPEKGNYQTCVSKSICRIKRQNEGFKQRWNAELHRKGVAKKRVGFQKQLEEFVDDAADRLESLVREVAHGMVHDEPPLAMKETKILLEWMVKIPGLTSLVMRGRKNPDYFSSVEIENLVESAIRADVAAYFHQVFRPAIEHGLWCKKEPFRDKNFNENADVMLTMLKSMILKRKD